MKNKTLTINKNEEENYLLYSGEERKRKFGFFGYSDKMHFVKKKMTIPQTILYVKDDELRIVFRYLVENEPHYIFGRSFKKKEENDGILFEGNRLKHIYKLSKIMDNAKKIPCEPSYVGGGFGGDIIPRGVNIEDEIYWKTFNAIAMQESLRNSYEWKTNFFGDNYQINYLTLIHRKTKIPRRKIKEIDKLYPLDDNKEEIKESDLVKIILR